MPKFLMTSIGIIFALGLSLRPSWAAIVTPDDSIMPCDKVSIDNKPPCTTDTDSVKRPAPVPTEKDTIIIPPEIPAEKLPDRKNIPAPPDAGDPGIKPPPSGH
ncbi:MAG: hypothetical protein ACAH07_01070 [Methylophilaceae bacterium]|jgi:hypothetical protein